MYTAFLLVTALEQGRHSAPVSANQRQEDVLHDFVDSLVLKRLQCHQKLVARQIARQRENARRNQADLDSVV